MSTKAFLSAHGFMLSVGLFAFTIWAEWGPYVWFSDAQIAINDNYTTKGTFVLTSILFLIPAILLLIASRGRAAITLALGVPGLLVLVHLAATIYLVSTGGTQAPTSTFEAAVRNANFVPHNITLEKSQLPVLELDKTSGISSSRYSDAGADLYIPYAPAFWPSPTTMVVLHSKSENLKKLAEEKSLTGVIHKAPLPYLVRHSWPQNPSLFAIIIEDRATVRRSWGLAAVVYVALLISLVVNRVISPRASKAPQAAQI
ncbi:MAG: hypothetical protein Q8M07_14880 [Prosthecobacter sp.]|nr:hypothetical protein [Prosthecobacter sp.]